MALLGALGIFAANPPGAAAKDVETVLIAESAPELGTESLALAGPTPLAVGQEGEIALVDRRGFRVLRFAADGTPRPHLSYPARSGEASTQVVWAALSHSGTVYLAAPTSRGVLALSGTDRAPRLLGETLEGRDSLFRYPGSVSVGHAAGLIHVWDPVLGLVLSFLPDGELVETHSGTGLTPYPVAADQGFLGVAEDRLGGFRITGARGRTLVSVPATAGGREVLGCSLLGVLPKGAFVLHQYRGEAGRPREVALVVYGLDGIHQGETIIPLEDGLDLPPPPGAALDGAHQAVLFCQTEDRDGREVYRVHRVGLPTAPPSRESKP